MHQIMLDLDVRPYGAGDAPHLLNIDLKGNEHQFSVRDWQLLNRSFPNWKILMACHGGTPEAFVVYDIDSFERVASIHKLAALCHARTIGLENVLLEVIHYDGRVKGITYVDYIVSSTECRGKDDPYDQSELLLRSGYRCVETIKDAFEAYGEEVDGYLFRKPLFEE